MLCASLGVTLYTILYDDFLLRGHLIFRNLCIAAGYLAFEVGALFIMSKLPAILQFRGKFSKRFHFFLQNQRGLSEWN